MSYKPYPSASKPVAAERGPAPRSVLNAVKLMYAGAAVSTVSLIVELTNTSGLKTAIRKAKPSYNVSQVNHLYNQIIEVAIISAIFGILLWLVMAWANGKGMGWARIVACVLFAFNTVDLFAIFRQPGTAINLVFPVLVWLVGLGAIILLWRPESSEFYKPRGLA
jgi:hypothetical protein